ncbi:MAG: hypothetical protein PUE63_00135 [Lachnospiraceae bacterium]|nr:hypothetical protein [Lachnospiraceae bacterium]
MIRQDNGLPLTYLHSPGSVPDISQAQEMISFIDKTSTLTGKKIELCLICDRGYISGKNLRQMDEAHIRYKEPAKTPQLVAGMKAGFSFFDIYA